MRARLAVFNDLRRHVVPAIGVCCLIVAVCALALCVAAPRQQAAADDDVALTAQAVSAIPYGGSEVVFVEADLSTPLGMFSDPDGTMQVTRENGNVHISFIPKNRTIFHGFYLNASIDDESTWNDFIAALGDRGSYAYDFTLPESYCGSAWPIAPLKAEAGGSSGTRTTSSQYYLAIPPASSIPEPVRTFRVTFTDGLYHVIDTLEVVAGGDVEPPADPVREGYVFDGWDNSYTNVTEDRTINAKWRIDGGVGYTVTFVDGFGSVIGVPQLVREGDSAVAPADPMRDGYTFTGWKPASFSNIQSDLTVEAQWLDNDQISLDATRSAIAALPDNPRDILRDTGNEAVASAAATYCALSGELQAQLSDEERLKLARCAIAVLPSDAYKVAEEHRSAIDAASTVVATLPDALKSVLDSDDDENTVSSNRSYGRYLECAVWALDSLKSINNTTLLAAGTYVDQVASTPYKGKNDSRRETWKTFSVRTVTVADNKMTATLETTANSFQSLKVGGQEYENLQTDSTKGAYFEIPIALKTTFHFSVKARNATDDTDAVPYELTVVGDEATMTPSIILKGGSDVVAVARNVNLNTLVKGGSSDTAGKSTASASKTGSSKTGANGKTVKEVEVGGSDDVMSIISNTDLGPAVAGLALLFVSGGALAFTLRFLRREAVHA